MVENVGYTKVVIVGGGFAGIKCALELAKHKSENLHITLITDRPHFEYHGALYRLVAGHSPLEVCIPLDTIFEHKLVERVIDKIENIDLDNKQLRGKTHTIYHYDVLVLALGSETSYYHIPGLEKHALGFKSIQEALELKRHLHQSFESCKCDDKNTQICNTHFIIVGGGASGTELAGELAQYTKKLAQKHNIDPTLITIDLIQSPNRLLPNLPLAMSQKIEERLRSLGINIFFNRRVVKKNVEQVYLKDIQMKAKTLIWTAGVTGSTLIKKTTGFRLDPQGRVEVTASLQAKGMSSVYILGDSAATVYSGMAATALYDGWYVASNLIRKLTKKPKLPYAPQQPIYAIPIGADWAAVLFHGHTYYGIIGWWLRRYLDWKVFTAILPFNKALTAFRSHGKLCEECPICSREN